MNSSALDPLLTIAATYFFKFGRDIYLPAMPLLVGVFSATSTQLQYSLSGFFVALFLARLFWPILSARYSLKSIIIWNIALFIYATSLSLFYTNFWVFILVRFIQGFTVGAFPSLMRGYVFERRQNIGTIKVLSYTSLATVWAPSLAVLIGGYLIHWFNWQAISFVMIIFAALYGGLLIGFVTSKPPSSVRPSIPKLYYDLMIMSIRKDFLRYTLPFSFLSAGLAIYLTISPFMFIDYFGLSPAKYGQLTLVVFTVMMIGQLIVGWMIDLFSEDTIISLGVGVSLLASLLFVLGTALMGANFTLVVLLSGFYLLGYGMLLPVGKTAVMANNSAQIYSSTALLGVISGLFSAVGSGFVAYFSLTSVSALAYCLVFTSVLSLLCFWIFADTPSKHR
jgi:DHA1 family bicyclomycin/chloramphenicol resistance-like MFS transporter